MNYSRDSVVLLWVLLEGSRSKVDL